MVKGAVRVRAGVLPHKHGDENIMCPLDAQKQPAHAQVRGLIASSLPERCDVRPLGRLSGRAQR